MRQFIRNLAEKEGLSVLVSSHLLSEIQLLCDRVAIMSKGEIIQIDSVENLTHQTGETGLEGRPSFKRKGSLGTIYRGNSGWMIV